MCEPEARQKSCFFFLINYYNFILSNEINYYNFIVSNDVIPFQQQK